MVFAWYTHHHHPTPTFCAMECGNVNHSVCISGSLVSGVHLRNPNPHDYYAAMRIKIHLGNAPNQITAVWFDHLHELVIADSKLVKRQF